ncbi:hypothetical protein [Gottfriedia solisilvae]|uniref:Uncharacterized protein n=1 Tax=Gottfriedia solisilvae TaxID=1516104 RepID=A0A8J3F0P2_9BACI|nr:hypothetical protein [Gottfriedia solisilvae]GGI15721.1 hypothetical protein GCM10007380_29440 [Gottfriedia solisilvae]
MLTGWICICVSVLISFLSIYNRPTKDDRMNQMMFTMIISMTTGLSIGVLITLTMPQQFFYSLLLSMGLSASIGLFIGLRLNFLALLEGIFTGMMSGMMGSMMVSMLSITEAKTLLLICLLLVTCTSIFCSIMFLSDQFPKLLSSFFPAIFISSLLIIFTVYYSFSHDESNFISSDIHNQHSQ